MAQPKGTKTQLWEGVQTHTFLWEGKDRRGNKVKGQTDGHNTAVVKAMLRKQGINPTRVRKEMTIFGLGGSSKKKKKIKPGDIAIFARQTATMMSAGVPLVQSLQIMAKGAENPSVKELIETIRADIESGSTLSEALSKHPAYFDDLFVNLVNAGEKSGALETLLDKIATYKERTEEIKAKVRKALYYPSAVITVAFIVMGILLYFVVPQFQSLFQGFGAELPAFTQMVIGLSQFVQSWWWAMLLGIGGIIGAFIWTHKRSPGLRRGMDKFVLKLPVVGDILYKAAVARFARTLATMFAAGVPLVEALESVAKASGNIVFEESIDQMRDSVASGQRLQATMEQTRLFPNMSVQMVAIGEEAGSLDAMCTKVADFYESEVNEQVDSLSSLLEPMIMAIIGVMVGGLVVAMYLPIFKLGSVV